jgi:hypothetical protein
MSKRSPKNVSLGAREYSKFRETVDGEYVVATSNEDYAIYPASVHATLQNETSVIATPGAGKALKIKYLMVNNAGDAQNLVSLREGAGGVDKFQVSIPQYGGTWNYNFVNGAWLLDANTALVVQLGSAGSVYVTVGYEVVDVSALNLALTESVSLAESQASEHVEG